MYTHANQSWGSVSAKTTSARGLRLLAVTAAVVTNLVILMLSRLAMGELPRVSVGGDTQTVTGVEVLVMTLIVGGLAWALLALLERTTGKAKRIWTVIAMAVTVVSLLGPLGGVTIGSKIVLALMHLATAAVIVLLMRHSTASYAARRLFGHMPA